MYKCNTCAQRKKRRRTIAAHKLIIDDDDAWKKVHARKKERGDAMVDGFGTQLTATHACGCALAFVPNDDVSSQ